MTDFEKMIEILTNCNADFYYKKMLIGTSYIVLNNSKTEFFFNEEGKMIEIFE